MRKTLTLALCSLALSAGAQKKAISPELMGIFIEDINYSVDGGLNAELLQNGSFEYTASDVHRGQQHWQPMTAWELVRERNIAYTSVETANPLNANNRHYLDLEVVTPGSAGVALRNGGWDGIPVEANGKYHFSVWMRSQSAGEVPLEVLLQSGDKERTVVAKSSLTVSGDTWQLYTAELSATAAADSASLLMLFHKPAMVSIDQVSLMPNDTYKGHGLRRDLCEALEALHPQFVRFPGGCLAHGDGLKNIYHWKRTIGPVEQRQGQRNIWNYRQSYQLGYHEFLQLCEDLDATPLPVLAAGVSCQNSGGNMGEGQEAIPMDQMPAYIQDILDLIEYCNGAASTTWGAKRAAAGHPKPFNLKYLGIGNEDRITPAFEERFAMICQAIKSKHPEINIVGTSGPFDAGEDYDKGWAAARKADVALVDEHYYKGQEWFRNNLKRYDAYPRQGPKVYLGEWASWGNKWSNALAEAAYLTSLERNADVVHFASYAPLLARLGHTQWNPDLIYFDNHGVYPTVNYLVQQLFGSNAGVYYVGGVCEGNDKVQTSCVLTSGGDVVLKLVNFGDAAQSCAINLAPVGKHGSKATLTVLKGDPKAKNTREHQDIEPVVTPYKIAGKMTYEAPAYSVSMIRISKK